MLLEVVADLSEEDIVLTVSVEDYGARPVQLIPVHSSSLPNCMDLEKLIDAQLVKMFPAFYEI